MKLAEPNLYKSYFRHYQTDIKKKQFENMSRVVLMGLLFY